MALVRRSGLSSSSFYSKLLLRVVPRTAHLQILTSRSLSSRLYLKGAFPGFHVFPSPWKRAKNKIDSVVRNCSEREENSHRLRDDQIFDNLNYRASDDLDITISAKCVDGGESEVENWEEEEDSDSEMEEDDENDISEFLDEIFESSSDQFLTTSTLELPTDAVNSLPGVSSFPASSSLTAVSDVSSMAERVTALKRSVKVDGRQVTAGDLSALYDFPLDKFQKLSIEAYLRGFSVVVSAPTSSGKTLIAESASAASLANGKRLFYTTPLKALSNQKFRDFRLKFGPDNVGLLTGDIALNREAPIVIMTTEILRNMLYATSAATVEEGRKEEDKREKERAGEGGTGADTLSFSDSSFSDVSTVVLDEVHYLSDIARGTVWEESVIYCPKHIQLLCLSATVANPDELSGWIEKVHGPTSLVTSSFRPVPLEWHFSKRQGIFPLLNAQGNGVNSALLPRLNGNVIAVEEEGGGRERGRKGRRAGSEGREGERSLALSGWRLKEQLQTLRRRDVPRVRNTLQQLKERDMLPAIWFIFSRRGCDQAVSYIEDLDLLDSRSEKEKVRTIVEDFRKDFPDAVREGHVSALLKGVASHHAGCLPKWKGLIEELFQKGLVKVVFATETLAAGIDMPCRTTVLSSLSKRNDEGHSLLSPNSLLQMGGRAGRRGRDEKGNVVIVQSPFEGAEECVELLKRGADPLVSQFNASYGMALNLLGGYRLWQKSISNIRLLEQGESKEGGGEEAKKEGGEGEKVEAERGKERKRTMQEARALIEKSFGNYLGNEISQQAVKRKQELEEMIGEMEREREEERRKGVEERVSPQALGQLLRDKENLRKEKRALKILKLKAALMKRSMWEPLIDRMLEKISEAGNRLRVSDDTAVIEKVETSPLQSSSVSKPFSTLLSVSPSSPSLRSSPSPPFFPPFVRLDFQDKRTGEAKIVLVLLLKKRRGLSINDFSETKADKHEVLETAPETGRSINGFVYVGLGQDNCWYEFTADHVSGTISEEDYYNSDSTGGVQLMFQPDELRTKNTLTDDGVVSDDALKLGEGEREGRGGEVRRKEVNEGDGRGTTEVRGGVGAIVGVERVTYAEENVHGEKVGFEERKALLMREQERKREEINRRFMETDWKAGLNILLRESEKQRNEWACACGSVLNAEKSNMRSNMLQNTKGVQNLYDDEDGDGSRDDEDFENMMAGLERRKEGKGAGAVERDPERREKGEIAGRVSRGFQSKIVKPKKENTKKKESNTNQDVGEDERESEGETVLEVEEENGRGTTTVERREATSSVIMQAMGDNRTAVWSKRLTICIQNNPPVKPLPWLEFSENASLELEYEGVSDLRILSYQIEQQRKIVSQIRRGVKSSRGYREMRKLEIAERNREERMERVRAKLKRIENRLASMQPTGWNEFLQVVKVLERSNAIHPSSHSLLPFGEVCAVVRGVNELWLGLALFSSTRLGKETSKEIFRQLMSSSLPSSPRSPSSPSWGEERGSYFEEFLLSNQPEKHERQQSGFSGFEGFSDAEKVWESSAVYLEDLKPAELAGVCAALVSEGIKIRGGGGGRGRDQDIEYDFSDAVWNWLRLAFPKKEWLEGVQLEHSVQIPCDLDPTFSGLVEAWVSGVTWQQLIEGSGGMDEGDAARLLRRTIDCLSQIPYLPHLGPVLGKTARQAAYLMDRPPISELIG